MKKSIFKAALIFCMILCLASGLAVFTACTVGQKDAGEDTSGITSGDSDSDGDNTGDNDGGDTSGDSDNMGDETGDNAGDNTGDDTGTPPAEITEEQYAKQNIELLKAHLISNFKEDNKLFQIKNIDIIKVNKAKSEIYFSCIRYYMSLEENCFIIAELDKGFFNVKLQKELNEKLKVLNSQNYMDFTNAQTVLQPEISEELFNEFCNYIKRQSYTYGDEVIDFSAIDPQNLEIINVTNSISDGRRRGFGFKILDTKSNKIYGGRIMGALGSSAVDDQIIELMGKTTNTFEITEISEFQEFELSA